MFYLLWHSGIFFLCLLNAVYAISRLLAVSYFFALRLATSAVLLLFSSVLADRFGIFKVLASSLMLVIPLLIIIFFVISVKVEGWLLPLVLVLGVITEAPNNSIQLAEICLAAHYIQILA